ncbi:MAG: hypothetical protein ACXVI9_08205, partial [Mucilaginibacter sp.]
MRKFLPLLFVVVIAPTILFAQSNFKPGCIVGFKGDTTKGFIDYREWSFNPTRINFKQSLDDKQSRQLTANDIIYFELTGFESYRLYTGPITMDDPNHVNESRDTSTKTGAFFLKILQKGRRVTLYSYTDEVKTRFFIQEEGRQPGELIYRSYLAADETSPEKRRQVTENIYFRQLSVVADKYHLLDGAMQSEIRHADYYKQNLLKIVSRINNLSKSEYREKYNEKTKINFFVSGALGMVNIKTYGTYAAAGGKAASSIVPALSFGVNMWADHNTGAIRFILEGTVSGNKYNSIYIYTGSPYVPVRYSYKDTWVALSPQIVYNYYNTAAFKAFVGIGLAFTIHNYTGTYDINYQNTQVTNAPLKSDNFLNNQGGSSFFDTFNIPVAFKAGMCFKEKIEVFARYYAPYQVSQDHFFQLNTGN